MLALKLTFIIITAALSLYGIVTKDFRFQEFMYLALAGMFIVMGLEQYKAQKKITSYMMFAVALFSIITVGTVWLRG